MGLLKAILIKSIDVLYVTDPNSITLIEILKQTINAIKSRIINVDDPTDEYDAANKKYVDSLKNSLNFDNLTFRYLKYEYLERTFKPTFWVSAYINQGIKVMDESTITKSTGIEEITGSGNVNSGTFTFIKEDNNIALRLSGDNRILSTSKYQNYYIFILIMKKILIQVEDYLTTHQKISYLVFGGIMLEVFG